MNQLDAVKAREGLKKWEESKSATSTRDRLSDALWGAYLYGYMAGMKDAATEAKPHSVREE